MAHGQNAPSWDPLITISNVEAWARVKAHAERAYIVKVFKNMKNWKKKKKKKVYDVTQVRPICSE